MCDELKNAASFATPRGSVDDDRYMRCPVEMGPESDPCVRVQDLERRGKRRGRRTASRVKEKGGRSWWWHWVVGHRGTTRRGRRYDGRYGSGAENGEPGSLHLRRLRVRGGRSCAHDFDGTCGNAAFRRWHFLFCVGTVTYQMIKFVICHDPCPVCFRRVDLVTFPCAHGMCAKCLSRMLMRDGRCCMCRTQLVRCKPAVVPDNPRTLSLSGNEAKELFGMRIDDTLYVTHVRGGSVARRERVRVGDRLIGVNGLPCWNREVTEGIVRASTVECRLVFEAPASPSKSPRTRLRDWFRRVRVRHTKRA